MEETEWLVVNTPGDNGSKPVAEGGKDDIEQSNKQNRVDEIDPALASEIAEKSGPLSAEETEKLLEWLKLGSRCIKIRLADAFG